MGILINSADFIGKYKLSSNTFQATELDNFIEQYETNYLYDLLGKTLGDLFIASVVNYLPVGATYLAIYNVIELDNYHIRRNEGMKKMLLGFIYWEWARKYPIKNTISGQVVSTNENSINVFDNWGMTNRYNSSVNDYQIIQYYINENSTDYTDYNGMYKSYALPF